jgi:hypothetical protein
MGECIEKLRVGEDVFYDLRHQTIFKALAEMYDSREAIDIITLQQRLKDSQLLEQVGGIAYLSVLPDAVPSAANLSYYLDIVREKYLLRKMIHVCTDVVGRVYDFEGEVDALMDEVERDISEPGPGAALRATIPLSAITVYADPEHGVTPIAAASPLTQNHFVVYRHARRRRGLVPRHPLLRQLRQGGFLPRHVTGFLSPRRVQEQKHPLPRHP